MSTYLTTAEAAKRLTQLQRRANNIPRPCTLEGDKVKITALQENAFQIISDPCENPVQLESYKYLDSIGASIQTGFDKGADGKKVYIAILTLDSMLHYIIKTRKLKVT